MFRNLRNILGAYSNSWPRRRRPMGSAKRRPNAPRPVLFKQADTAKPISNRKIATALGVGASTIDRDLAPNGAPAKKTAKETNEPKPVSAPNGAWSRGANLVQPRNLAISIGWFPVRTLVRTSTLPLIIMRPHRPRDAWGWAAEPRQGRVQPRGRRQGSGRPARPTLRSVRARAHAAGRFGGRG